MLFLANIEASSTEGIYKKIRAQARAWSIIANNVTLVCKKNKGVFIVVYEKGNYKGEKSFEYISLLQYGLKYVKEEQPQIVYIRHMVPSISLIRVLKLARDFKAKIYYEIPTYPYYGEQIRSSQNKLKTGIKLCIETVFWPVIYYYIDKLLVIISNSKVKRYSKMLEITNGIDEDNICTVKHADSENIVSFVGIGTIYAYHGYDRLIKAIEECGGYIGGKKIIFKIIGESFEINKLKSKVTNSKCKDHYFFLGRKTTKELNELLTEQDIGVGCLALFRRNADIDTTLKVVEYMSRGMLILSSGLPSGMKSNKKICILVKNDESNIDMNSVYKEIEMLQKRNANLQAQQVLNKYKWERVYSTCLGEEK